MPTSCSLGLLYGIYTQTQLSPIITRYALTRQLLQSQPLVSSSTISFLNDFLAGRLGWDLCASSVASPGTSTGCPGEHTLPRGPNRLGYTSREAEEAFAVDNGLSSLGLMLYYQVP